MFIHSILLRHGLLSGVCVFFTHSYYSQTNLQQYFINCSWKFITNQTVSRAYTKRCTKPKNIQWGTVLWLETHCWWEIRGDWPDWFELGDLQLYGKWVGVGIELSTFQGTNWIMSVLLGAKFHIHIKSHKFGTIKSVGAKFQYLRYHMDERVFCFLFFWVGRWR